MYSHGGIFPGDGLWCVPTYPEAPGLPESSHCSAVNQRTSENVVLLRQEVALHYQKCVLRHLSF